MFCSVPLYVWRMIIQRVDAKEAMGRQKFYSILNGSMDNLRTLRLLLSHPFCTLTVHSIIIAILDISALG